MKRAAAFSAIVAVLTTVAFLAHDRGAFTRLVGESGPDVDSVWYHASDVSQLARTGRPQLVEFFHPD
jgi:hypothetical protein